LRTQVDMTRDPRPVAGRPSALVSARRQRRHREGEDERGTHAHVGRTIQQADGFPTPGRPEPAPMTGWGPGYDPETNYLQPEAAGQDRSPGSLWRHLVLETSPPLPRD
jgi:hypothetical protein